MKYSYYYRIHIRFSIEYKKSKIGYIVEKRHSNMEPRHFWDKKQMFKTIIKTRLMQVQGTATAVQHAYTCRDDSIVHVLYIPTPQWGHSAPYTTPSGSIFSPRPQFFSRFSRIFSSSDFCAAWENVGDF